MAAANPLQSLQEEATCPICLEYFIDPVTAKCGHSFCRPCVLNVCSEGEGNHLSCPQCRDVCPQGDLRANRHLQSIVECVKQLSAQQEGSPPPRKALCAEREERLPGEGLCAEREERPPGEGLCAEHEESLKLFCKEEEKLICVICRESKEHKAHTVHPIKEAAEEYKPKLQEWLKTLRRELGAVQQGKMKEKEDCDAMRKTLESERRKIETEFQRLQQLLKEQEKALLRRLEDMGKKIATVKNANVAKLSAQISSLEVLITEIEKKCVQPAQEFLKDIRSTLSRCKDVMDQTPGNIWKQFKVHITLDEDTAYNGLALFDGRSCMRFAATRQDRPSNPKRFTCRPWVLGREGFTSGRHYWELQVLQDGNWIVGAVRKSMNRKKGITLSPEGGAWTVIKLDGVYTACSSPRSPLSPHQRPMKLGLYLDCQGGRLSVYNADTMEALYTFTGAAFNGQVHPLFGVIGNAELRLL